MNLTSERGHGYTVYFGPAVRCVIVVFGVRSRFLALLRECRRQATDHAAVNRQKSLYRDLRREAYSGICLVLFLEGQRHGDSSSSNTSKRSSIKKLAHNDTPRKVVLIRR